MFNIKTLNKISACGTDIFDRDTYAVGDNIDNPDAIMVRSASMLEMELPDSLLAIARAGAGTNNIPIDRCNEKGIVVFNTPGANANGVKEMVIAGMLLCSRKVVPAIEWASTLKGNGAEVGKMVEKGKSAFGGPEIMGKTLGVIGLGAIGILVANAAKSLGMNVYGYDPFLSVDAAWGISRSIKHAKDIKEIFANCDYITLHVPLTDDTKGIISAKSIENMKDGVRILNFSRAELVKDEDVISALQDGKVAAYVTDFPTDAVLGVDGVIAIPHLGASTPESEDNCATMAAQELVDFLENGNIKNSVNLPNADMPRSGGFRVCVVHKNIPSIISHITSVFSDRKINIENMLNKSKKDTAYTMLDLSGITAPDDIESAIMQMDGIIRVIVIK